MTRTFLAACVIAGSTAQVTLAQAADDASGDRRMTLRFGPTSTLGLLQPEAQPGVQAAGGDEPALPDRIADPPWRVTFYWENDGEYFKPNGATDEQYTNGIGFSAAGPARFADDIGGWMPLRDHFDDPDHRIGFVLALQIYTPNDLSRADLIVEDRPYAGYLYLGTWWQRSDDTTMDRIEIDVGTIGPSSGAEGAQEWIHELIDDPDPMGWDNQLDDEIVFDVTLQRKWRVDLYEADRDFAVQLIPDASLTLGTVRRQVAGNVTLRAGWSIPNDFGPTRLWEPSVPVDTWRDDFGFYGFVRAGGRAVQHNVFLDGNNFNDSHSVSREPLVGEIQFGVVLRLYRYIEFGYSQTFMTPEFEERGDGHSFGAYTLGVSIPF